MAHDHGNDSSGPPAAMAQCEQPRGIARRAFLRRAIAAGVALPAMSSTLAACGGSTAAPTATSAGSTTGSATAAPAGSAQAGAKGGTLLYNGGSNPSGFDPHIVGDVVAWNVLDNIFDRLVRLNKEGSQPESSLAEQYETSPDGLTYTFHLRKGVKFQNGRELKAADVKWSFERIQDPNVPAIAKGYFADLDHIETPDDYTVKLIYKKIFAPLVLALTRLETAILPQEEVAKKDQWAAHPVGSGPFNFVSYTKDQAVVMQRNPDYWEQGLPKLDKVEQRVITQDEPAIIAVQTGNLHVTLAAATDLDKLKGSKGVQAPLIPSNYWAHLSLNCSKPPFNDVRVRQAIHLGVKRDDIAALAFNNTGKVSNTLLPEGNPFRAEVSGWEYDPKKAKQLLMDAGLANGFKATMRIVPSTTWNKPAAQIIQENLKAIGITVDIEQIEATTWFSEVFNQSQFEMSMTSHVSKVDPDLSMFDILHSGKFGTKNYTKFSDPDMDKLLDDGRTTADSNARKKIYADAQKIFVERSGYIVLNLQDWLYAVRDTVQNFTVLPTAELRWKETGLSAS